MPKIVDPVRGLRTNILQLQSDNEKKNKTIATQRVIIKTLNGTIQKLKSQTAEGSASFVHVPVRKSLWQKLVSRLK